MSSKTQVTAVFPAPKQQPSTVVVVQEQKCMKGCPPVLSKGCELCSNTCGDYYINPLCSSIGITGLLVEDTCMVYDEQWGGCGTCIGCKKDCGDTGFCSYVNYRGPFNRYK